VRKLHIPYKYSTLPLNFTRMLRGSLAKNTGGDTVSPTQLQDVLQDAFELFGEQQRQDWLEIERWAEDIVIPGASPSTFNATIDSAQTVADPTNHVYPNLASLVANESWTNTFVFHVYMVDRPDNPVVETAATSLPGPIVIEGPGAGTQGTAGWFTENVTSGGRAIWDFQGAVITSTDMVHLKNITLTRTTAGAQTRFFASAPLVLENCLWLGIVGGAWHVAQPGNGLIWAVDSAFVGAIQFSNKAALFNCHMAVSNSAGFTLNTQPLLWLGGSMILGVGALPGNLTIGANAVIVLSRYEGAPVFDTLVGGNIPISVSASTHFYMVNEQLEGNNVNVSALGGTNNLWLYGQFGDVTTSTPANTSNTKLDVLITGTLDVTGAADVDCSLQGTSARSIFRGLGVQARVHCQPRSGGILAGTMVSLIDCDQSLFTITGNGTGTTGTLKLYSIDAASTNNVVVVSGETTFPAASTNASASTLVITSGGSPPSGTAGGDLTGTYPNPTLIATGPGATGPIGSATVVPVITIDAKGRVTALTSATITYRYIVAQWNQDNVAASQTNVALTIYGGTTHDHINTTRAGSVTGIVVESNTARTAGTATFEVTINGTGTGLTAVLDGTNTTKKATTQAVGLDTYVAGDAIGVRVTTDGAWSPTTADVQCSVELTE
jgi:hypothetical protein